MGRSKKYKTEQEKTDAQRLWSKEYYYRNKEKINKKPLFERILHQRNRLFSKMNVILGVFSSLCIYRV